MPRAVSPSPGEDKQDKVGGQVKDSSWLMRTASALGSKVGGGGKGRQAKDGLPVATTDELWASPLEMSGFLSVPFTKLGV